MRHAEALAPALLVRIYVDADDHCGADQAKPLDHVQADAAKAKDWSLVTAESCTAGKLAASLSEAPGASVRLHGGFVTYTKDNGRDAIQERNGRYAYRAYWGDREIGGYLRRDLSVCDLPVFFVVKR